jgi:PAS domain S-box-containing protein
VWSKSHFIEKSPVFASLVACLDRVIVAKEGMTVADTSGRLRMPPRPRNPARAIAVQARVESAPALFRLLSDSALARAALSACGLPVALLDATAPGRPITYVNSAFEGFFGFRETEARGRGVIDLLFRGDGQVAEHLFGERVSRRRLRACRNDGSPLHVEAAASGIRGADGQLTHWVVTFVDRTELESMREELAALRTRQAAA